jgi:hypothetical protein
MFPVNAHQRRQAGVYACMVYLLRRRVVLGDNYCAGTAASFSTPELGACEPDATQVFEEGDFWVGLVECDFGAIKVEDDCVVPILRHGVERADLGVVHSRLRYDEAGSHSCGGYGMRVLL